MFTPHRARSFKMLESGKSSASLSGVSAVSELSVAIRELLGFLQTLTASSVSRGDVFKGKVGDANISLIFRIIHTIQRNYDGAQHDLSDVHKSFYDLAMFLQSDDGKKVPNGALAFKTIDSYFAENPKIAEEVAKEIETVEAAEKGAPTLRPGT